MKVLIPEERLQERIRELGQQISKDYANKDLVIVAVLKGSVYFLTDLTRQITTPLAIDFVSVSSYGDAFVSSGVIRLEQDVSRSITGKDVLIIEDIVDTGLTLDYLISNFESRRPRSLKVCTLLHKPSHTIKEVPLEYVGFSIEDKFVVGYGLDYKQFYRNLPYIAYVEKGGGIRIAEKLELPN